MKKLRGKWFAAVLLGAGAVLAACLLFFTSVTRAGFVRSWMDRYPAVVSDARHSADPFFQRLSDAARERTTHVVRYDPAYLRIPYPNGDVPADRGVCSDEVIRAYRTVGIDLQKEVHEDIVGNFSIYPKLWRQIRPDTSIDHRRVPNLMTFFARKGMSLPLSRDPAAYHPGDIVAWQLNNGLLHIGMVVEPRSSDAKRRLVVHNIGRGPVMEDALFVGEIIGHFQYKKTDPVN